MRANEMRFTVASPHSGLGDIINLSMQAGMGLNPTALRTLGFTRLEAMLDQPEFRAAAPLPDHAQVYFDGAVRTVGTQRLQFIAELYREGLTFSLPDAMSIPFIETNYEGNIGAPFITMNPEAKGEDQLPVMTAGRLPIYIVKDQFSLGIRELGMSRRAGLPLDVRIASQKTRAVNEMIEYTGINGAQTIDGQSLVVGGYSAPGLLNAPNANVKVLTASAWTGTTPVGTTIMAEINAMFAQLVGDFKRGPYTLFIPTAVDQALNIDFKANGNDSIRARISQMNAGGRPLRIVVVDMLPATKVVLVQMTNDVLEVIDGIRPTIIPYTSATGMTFHSMIIAIQVPRFFTDSDGNSGIVIGTLT